MPMRWADSIELAKTELEPELVLLAEHLADSPLTANNVCTWTRKDPKLARVLEHLQDGRVRVLESYSSKLFKLSTYEGCTLWGIRIIIPKPGREAVLQKLHEGCPCITKMKALARMYIWWPGINADFEKSVRLSAECQEVQSSTIALLNPWKWPTRLCARLHLHFAGLFLWLTPTRNGLKQRVNLPHPQNCVRYVWLTRNHCYWQWYDPSVLTCISVCMHLISCSWNLVHVVLYYFVLTSHILFIVTSLPIINMPIASFSVVYCHAVSCVTCMFSITCWPNSNSLTCCLQ